MAFSASLHADQPASVDLFQKGLLAYRNQDFSEARDSFLKLLQEGQQSPNILHNLALSNFQLGDKALAMALWRKALAMDPSFHPAIAGRDYLEASTNMRPWERDQLSLYMRRLLDSVSLHEFLWWLAGVLAFCGFLWIRYFAKRREALEDELPLPSFPFHATIVSFFFLLGATLCWFKVQHLRYDRATVIVARAEARSLPNDDSVALFEIAGGQEVIVRRQERDWLQVQNSDRATGWLKESEVLTALGKFK